jgi:hypothetical protein
MEHVIEYSINEITVTGEHKLVDGKTVGDRGFLVSPLSFMINKKVYTIHIIVYTTNKRALGNPDDYVALVGMVHGRKIYIRPAIDKYDPYGMAFEYTITNVPKDSTKEELDNIFKDHITNFIEGLDWMVQSASEKFEHVTEEDNLIAFTDNLINKK